MAELIAEGLTTLHVEASAAPLAIVEAISAHVDGQRSAAQADEDDYALFILNRCHFFVRGFSMRHMTREHVPSYAPHERLRISSTRPMRRRCCSRKLAICTNDSSLISSAGTPKIGGSKGASPSHGVTFMSAALESSTGRKTACRTMHSNHRMQTNLKTSTAQPYPLGPCGEGATYVLMAICTNDSSLFAAQERSKLGVEGGIAPSRGR
ncbi:hypothetical protein F8S13_01325 [Chloroflexia bacterium SDU3-3]|nr:hypothetical protein F8S13_01325 [Chloroflexia bacterium SDU3-3]